MTSSRYLVGPGERRGIAGTMPSWIGTISKIEGELTGGSLAIVEHPVPVGTAAPPHTHTQEDELSYVLEGTITVWIGEERFDASTGSYVYKPRNIEHAFWNGGPNPARLLEIIWPAGLEKYFEQMAELVARRDPRLDEKILQSSREHGVRMDPEKRAEFERRLGITSGSPR